MGAIHGLRVKSPYTLLKIEDIKIENKPNNHGYLYLKCLIDDSINFDSAIKASTDDKITVYEKLEDKDNSDDNIVNINEVDERNSRRLFDGIIDDIKTSNINGVYYLEIEALTSSVELDIQEKSRSFQNADMTYDELINIILKDYPNHINTQCIGQDQKTGKPLFQFKESDWNFLKRIASELNSELYADIINSNDLFYFGRPNNDSHELEDTKYYKAYKSLQRFREAGGDDAGHDTDYFYYELEKREQYDVGDDIYFKGKELYVNQYSAYALKDEIIYKYTLCRKNGIWQTKLYNSILAGASLDGKVIAREGEKVKLHLSIDEKQNKEEAAWFPFAPPTGNIMYCMPIIGTSARLYFPNETSEEPVVTGCVRNNGGSCQKTSDTTKRYLGTEHGNEIEMIPNALNIRGKEPVSISFDDNVGVTLTSHKKLTINADDDIIIKTPKNVKIDAQSQIFVAKTEAESGFSIESEFHFLGENVMKNGRDSEAYAPFDDEPQAAQPPEPPKEEKKPFDWGKLATNVLAGLAVVAAVTVAAVAIVATAGLAAGVVVAVGVGAAVSGTAAVASMAISDIRRGEVSDITDYMWAGGREAFIGALSGAIFGPFGVGEALGGKMALGAATNAFESIVRQKLNGEDINWGTVLFDGGIGALTAGMFHGGGKLIEAASPFAKNAFNKASSVLSENSKYAKIALENMQKGPKSVVLGSNLGNVDEALGRFAKEFKNAKNAGDTGRMNMAGKTHPVSGVEFDANGFPKFKSEYDMHLDPADYLKSRGTHFDRASKSLYSKIQSDPELASKFTRNEIEIFKEGGIPKRFTWHHNQEPGLMQLVDRTLHKQTGHDGGFSIWGPGNK
ncbi:HNH endonuclease [Clostridium sp.]|uniref:HNH endonuclease n=1 Tax=Clostridium sp. TaxID=1506 RepID=UPI00345C9E0F